ncbi:hypothetical protein [Singulisphaera sp. PoT]|uniref:hypothetical protein n=1 Tax=Singulisphaera sp. PoT TaxID=3411797 RepID=UPI003BF4DF87
MTDSRIQAAEPRRTSWLGGVKLWHLGLLVAYVAVAIQQVQAQRVSDPLLIGLAAVGFLGYAVIGVVAWKIASAYADRIGAVRATSLYFTFMAGLFLLATVIYVCLEYAHTLNYF